MSEKTLTIIKPDAVEKRHVGDIIAHLESQGFSIVAAKRLQLDERQAAAFYSVHHDKPFYDSLVAFMTSGPVWAMCLEREDAVRALRAVMGSTNPAEAAEGTIRAQYGSNIERNAVHGSDSDENAAIEISFFFSTAELI
jgi:nucleoside-diphosphate kinase